MGNLGVGAIFCGGGPVNNCKYQYYFRDCRKSLFSQFSENNIMRNQLVANPKKVVLGFSTVSQVTLTFQETSKANISDNNLFINISIG
jgi:hypothetical protein